MEGSGQSNPCTICLAGIGAGGGQAIFTAECSHTFHFHCISAVLAHGHLVCPLCNAHWRQLPFTPSTVQRRDPDAYDDDEQVEPASAPAGAASNGTMVIKTHCETTAIARDSYQHNFAVLVHAKAPGMTESEAAAPRAPLDLVTVLDVSGSMVGRKIALLKQAMGFVIDKLGPRDRLCVVSFSSGARRVTRLARMSEAGKALAKSAVESLFASGGTNIAEGLGMAAKVLDERRYRNPVASVILLSDGQDNYINNYTMMGQSGSNYEALVPPSFQRRAAGDRPSPIHTFGFGHDHDAAAMHVIAETTCGTFSFIENEAVIQDAFARCIGGLLSVVVQDARIAIECVHSGVRISSVNSGRYVRRVDEDGRAASIDVGELYADEERRFLLLLSVPRSEATDGGDTTLLKVSCRYRDAASGADVNVTAEDTVVARPEQVVDAQRSVEVARERIRVEVTEGIAAARAAAERGAHQEAVAILESRQQAVALSEAARGGDRMSIALESELVEMRMRVSTPATYAGSGQAFMLAGMNAHMGQRATTRHKQSARSSCSGWQLQSLQLQSAQVVLECADEEEEECDAYTTPAMSSMVRQSKEARKASAKQQSKAGKEPEGSK